MKSAYRESTRDFEPDLVETGRTFLATLDDQLDLADPRGLVEPRSRLLCAGLGLLGRLVSQALGGHKQLAEVTRASALLSLVTKVDDQVIDALPFHGGATTDRDELRARTRAYLEPTRLSIVTGQAQGGDPRLRLAAELGASLAALAANRGRFDRLMQTISDGFEIQAEAVAVLTRPPSEVTAAEVASITRRISGAWFHMIAEVGTLPAEVERSLSPMEVEGFYGWGSSIQRVDALADLEKDLADGHLSTFPGHLLWQLAPNEYLEAARRGDSGALYSLVRAHGIDAHCLADPEESPRALRALDALGEVSDLMAWIRHYLACRYLAHPRSRLGQSVVASQSPLFPATQELACSAL